MFSVNEPLERLPLAHESVAAVQTVEVGPRDQRVVVEALREEEG